MKRHKQRKTKRTEREKEHKERKDVKIKGEIDRETKRQKGRKRKIPTAVFYFLM